MAGNGRSIPRDVRLTIQESPEPASDLARRLGVSRRTVHRWRTRSDTEAMRPGPRANGSRTLDPHQVLAIVSFRVLARLPLDDCLFALQGLIPALNRSALFRCLRSNGLSDLAALKDDAAGEGWIDLHQLELHRADRTEFLFIAIDQVSRYAIIAFAPFSPGDSLDAAIEAICTAIPASVSGIRHVRAVSNRALDSAIAAACARRSIRCRRAKESEAAARVRSLVERHLEVADETARAKLNQSIPSFLDHFNKNCRLKALGGITPHEALIGSIRPARLRKNPPSFAEIRAQRDNVGQVPDDNREIILGATRSLLATTGPEGLSLSQVSRLAGVSRSSVYQHFGSRERLIAAATQWSSEQLTLAVFGDLSERQTQEGRFGLQVISSLANFAVRNPVMGQAWLLQMLASAEPSKDVFWREYLNRSLKFHDTPMAQGDIDAEVLSVILLAGSFLWPVWIKSRCQSTEETTHYVNRFIREVTRLAMFGTVHSEYFPDILHILQNTVNFSETP